MATTSHLNSISSLKRHFCQCRKELIPWSEANICYHLNIDALPKVGGYRFPDHTEHSAPLSQSIWFPGWPTSFLGETKKEHRWPHSISHSLYISVAFLPFGRTIQLQFRGLYGWRVRGGSVRCCYLDFCPLKSCLYLLTGRIGLGRILNMAQYHCLWTVLQLLALGL